MGNKRSMAGLAVAALCSVFVESAWAAEGQQAEAIPSLGCVGTLPVKVGDEFGSALKNAQGCRSAALSGARRMACKTQTLIGGLMFSDLIFEARGGLRVDTVSARGKPPRSCGQAMSAFIASLGPSWKVEALEEGEPGGLDLKAVVQGDQTLRLGCGKYGGLWLQIQDAWLSLPAGSKLDAPHLPQPASDMPLVQVAALARSSLSVSAQGVGEVVFAAIENYGNGVKNVRVPKARWSDLVAKYAWPDVEAALTFARRSESRLSPRSARAFEDYSSVVASDGWFVAECNRVWSTKKQ